MIKRPVRILTAVASLLAALGANGSAQTPAQRLIVRGTVAEADSLAALAGVSIQLIDSTGESRAVAVTDAFGRFRLDAPERGAYRVRATRIGFLKAESPLVRVDSAGAVVALVLTRGTVLDPLIVSESERPIRPTQQLIRGRLIDDDSGEPLENGTIELLDPRNRSVVSVTTGRDGHFRLVTPGPGTYSLLGRHIGHQPAHQRDFRLRLGDTVRVDFRLSRNAVLLAPALVTASAKPWSDRGDRRGIDDLNERIRRFDGRPNVLFVMRDTIDAYDRRRFDLASMLDRIVRRGPATRTGCAGSMIAVDNVIWPTPDQEMSALEMFPLNAIELVEVYTLPDIPAEFSAPLMSTPGARSSTTPPCQVVSIWTRLDPRRRNNGQP